MAPEWNSDASNSEHEQVPSISKPILAGLVILAVTIGGFGALASVTRIQGAVVAPGTVVVESWPKKVQHNEGGIVADIFVDDGSEVREGDVLLRLDDTQTRAKLAIVIKQLTQLRAQSLRLKAERDDQPEPKFSAAQSDDEAEAIATERALFHTRRTSNANQREQLKQQLADKDKEIEGIEADIGAIDDQRAIAVKEHANLNQLFEQKHVTITRVLQLEREIAGLRGRRGQQVAAIARAREAMGGFRIQLVQVDVLFKKDVLAELATVETKINELAEQRTQAEDFLNRVDIKAPRSGVVQDLAFRTKGGVVRPADVLMIVVPKGDRLVVEARASPQDIDQLAVGLVAVVRFSNFNRPTTPELNARVIRVSADVTVDQPGQSSFWRPLTNSQQTSPLYNQQSLPYYAIRIEIPESELKRLDGGGLMPGMQVEVFISTTERTVMSYLLKPIYDRLARAMRER
jgi:membrane fusion protein, type I secretion system